MHNIDPNDMDALFRDGADKHEFTYNPDAWALMEDKLDARKRKKYLLFWLIMGAILIAGIVGVYLFKTSEKESEKIVSNTNIEIVNNERKQGENISNKINSNDQIINDNELIDITNDDKVENSKTINNIAQDDSAERNEQYNGISSKVSRSYIGAQYSIQSENTGSLVNNEVVSVSPLNEQENSNNQSSTLASSTNVDNDIMTSAIDADAQLVFDQTQTSLSRGLFNLDQLKLKNNKRIKSENLTDYNFKLLPKSYEDIIEPKSTLRYVFTAFGSCDFSTVGFFRDAQSGFSVGTKVGVQLARKFQIDLGFAYSLKKYGSEGIDYNLEGGWNNMNGVSPTWMDGKGSILQIPMEVSYYFKGYENNSFFVNAGISTFLFNSEWYGFKYNPEDLLLNPDAIVEITNEEINRRNFHPAGIARISFGYQKVMSSKMAFELSPYLQIPLTGIGEGKVDLYTAGLQFAVKFNTK